MLAYKELVFSFIFYPHFNIHVHIICHNHIPVVYKIYYYTHKRKKTSATRVFKELTSCLQLLVCSPSLVHQVHYVGTQGSPTVVGLHLTHQGMAPPLQYQWHTLQDHR